METELKVIRMSVPQMDSEHAALVDEVNEFSVAVDADLSRVELEMRLTRLIEGFQRHFDSEEALMRSTGFPGLGAHAKEHRMLIEQMRGLQEGLGSGAIKVCHALAFFVRIWAEHHMMGLDTSFAHYLHDE